MHVHVLVTLLPSGQIYSPASQTLFFFFLLIGGMVGRKLIVWSNSHAKFVLHALYVQELGNEKRDIVKQPQVLNIYISAICYIAVARPSS